MGIVPVGHVVEEDHRVVLRSVVALVGERALQTVDSLLVRGPWNPRTLQLGHQMIAAGLVIPRRRVVVVDAEAPARLQPEIVRLAGMQTGWVEVLLGAGRGR